jgi:hypothetical protein
MRKKAVAKPRRRKNEKPVVVVDENGLSRIAFSPSFIKWAIGVAAGLVGLVVAWNSLVDRIENHWRLESIQTAKDAKVDADIKAARDKAEQDTKALARRAEVGRAWLFYSLGDFRANSSQQWAQVCPALKQPREVCERWAADAMQARQEAAEAKRSATDAGKDK